MHCTTLQNSTQNYSTLHYTTLYKTTQHYTTPHTTLHYTTHNTTLHDTTVHCLHLRPPDTDAVLEEAGDDGVLAELRGVPLHQGAAHQRLVHVDDGRVVPDGEPRDHGGDGGAGGSDGVGVAEVADY